MAHAYHHAESSARRYGGCAEDYLALHAWFDATKALIPTPQHRALRYHSLGIFDAEALFGPLIETSDGRSIPTRFIGEQHLREDCRRIPTPAHWLMGIPIAPWMVNGQIEDPRPEEARDEVTLWRAAVQGGQTLLGLADWSAERALRRDTGP